MSLKCTLSITFIYMLAWNSSFAATEKVYKWTDGKGQVHYSQRPPLNTQTEVVKPQTGHSDPVEYKTAPPPSTNNEVKPEIQAPSLKDKDRCEGARKASDTLKTFARVRIKGENGEYRYLTPDEQQQKIVEANKAIEESCE
ncbi:hypothetical protein GCM10011613_22450 [Cellvibrio zantedeschiae]|uniref:DUF4124 domain-containing protein n=1 Tax=Cellvibrio zantedeschiae TaxID=1237077 RepID=A0ABQ3B2X2_9GAMM|nr:DUF4124 domain-containing protein [Cellvibrio zantedeschiae]GGY77413.1 hypothetical protein GCM10011613_22450 [Cellvibrio zantedeschiae]